MPHLICYDVTDNSLRARLATKIIAAGFDRINKSVYLGTVSERVLRDLQNWLTRQMSDHADLGDSLILLPVNASQIDQLVALGNDNLDRDDLNGRKNSLFI